MDQPVTDLLMKETFSIGTESPLRLMHQKDLFQGKLGKGILPAVQNYAVNHKFFDITTTSILNLYGVYNKHLGSECRDQSVHAPSQWETTLHCKVVSHWLSAYTKWSLKVLKKTWIFVSVSSMYTPPIIPCNPRAKYRSQPTITGHHFW